MMEHFPVFDLHCDTAFELWKRGEDLLANSCHIDLARASTLLHHHQFFAFCTYGAEGDKYGLPAPEPMLEQMLADFSIKLAKYPDRITVCRTAQDLMRANKVQKCAAFLSLEGAEGIGCDEGRLEELKEFGFTVLNLTWNSANALSGSCHTGEGLTAKGKAFVKKAQSLGFILDVSHLSDKAFRDLVSISQGPIIASHSNCRAVCDHPRNLTDEQIKVICNLDGVVGLNLYAPFLNESGKATFDDVRRHIDHVLELGGQHHLCLGGDLDGCDELPEGFFDLTSLNDLAKYLIDSGLEETLVLNIFNNNAVRFLLQHLSDEPALS